MQIHLSRAAQLELPAIPLQGPIEIPDGMSIDSFLEHAGVRKEHRRFILPMVNNTKVSLRYILQEGDSLFLLTPVGGG